MSRQFKIECVFYVMVIAFVTTVTIWTASEVECSNTYDPTMCEVNR